ncbi:MAG: WecB/TagA/CpsF family glycosyltransferase, partial [Rhodoferax sp.]
MNNWMNSKSGKPFDLSRLFDERADRQLRHLDIVLAALALLVLGLPVALGWIFGRLHSQTALGREGRPFQRWHLALPANRLGRVLGHLGVAQWPVVLNILNGDMAWVGPRLMPQAAQASAHPALTLVRPGLVNRWALRQRTAVNYGTEFDADLEYVCVRSLRHDLGLLLHAFLLSWLPAPKTAQSGRITVGDVAFDNVNMAQALSQISRMLDGQAAQQVSFVNPACVNIAAGNRGYRRLLARAALVLPDGIGIKIAADLLGQPLRQNVNGTDLFPRLCEMLELRGARIFLLGGQPGVVEKVAQVIQAQWPGLRIAGLRDGFFSVADEGDVAAQVRHSQADLLLVARGVPMQDEFIDRHLHQLGVRVAMGVGGLFDFVCGRINRA